MCCERLQEQQMLLELRDRALDFMNEGIWIADTQGRLLYANQGFSMTSGYPVPEIVGQPWYFNQVASVSVSLRLQPERYVMREDNPDPARSPAQG